MNRKEATMGTATIAAADAVPFVVTAQKPEAGANSYMLVTRYNVSTNVR